MIYPFRHKFFFVGLALIAGCVIDTVPLPEDRPTAPSLDGRTGSDAPVYINPQALFFSAEPVVLVGTESAVPNGSTVIIDNAPRQNFHVQFDAAVDGSFVTPITASVGDTIMLSVAIDATVIESLAIVISSGSMAAEGTTADLAGVPASAGGTPEVSSVLTVTAPDVSGIVTVSGPPGSVSVGIVLIIADPASGDATQASVFADGSVTATLAAVSGDHLMVFATEPASSMGGGAPFSLVVP